MKAAAANGEGGGGGDSDRVFYLFPLDFCKITALHTKGKIFPWPLVILDGLMLAQRTGELFAFMRAYIY